jgi:hypothetical protein
MNKVPTELKAARLSTSIPAELHKWLVNEQDRLAGINPLGTVPPLASLVAHALYEYKAKADKRAQEDMKHAGEQVREAAKKVRKSKE